jgi:hypothetical protein
VPLPGIIEMLCTPYNPKQNVSLFSVKLPVLSSNRFLLQQTLETKGRVPWYQRQISCRGYLTVERERGGGGGVTRRPPAVKGGLFFWPKGAGPGPT